MFPAEDDEQPPDDPFWEQLDDDALPETADWAGDELEAAYLRAMEALEASDAQLPELDSGVVAEPQDAAESPIAIPQGPAAEDRIPPAQLSAEITELSEKGAPQDAVRPPSAVTPRQILEALLFVGGEPLTTRKLAGVLRGEFSAEFIEAELDGLNSLYARQGRPYEIRLGDGGYRMTLRAEFEKIRRKTYGLGPKEVKLSQEAIEVLAVIAYQQPLTAAAIEESKPGSSAVLRQLLRRELIVVERPPGRPREIAYRTTARFLSLFGIRSLNELPRLEQVVYK